ncbi:MAG: outer membrane beta-barrel protein [Holosporales bacterium]|jgi:opacity protein-like surface antigen|nr:outer membrane beta-barrel protein [Holosporales bacterium]
MNKSLIRSFSLLSFIFVSETIKAEGYDIDTKQAIENAANAEQENANAQVEKSNNFIPSESGGAESITGFYGGVSLGMDVLKSKFNKEDDYKAAGDDPEKKKLAKKKNSKTGFLGEVFCGYNCQFGKCMVGLEGSIGMPTSKNNAEVGIETKNLVGVKRKYTFGIAPRVGYAITDSLFGYVNFGTVLSKYKFDNKNKSTDEKKSNDEKKSKSPTKASMFLGLGVEQYFGPLFVRGECNKVFNKNLGTVEGTKASTGSYVFKIGGGYRF